MCNAEEEVKVVLLGDGGTGKTSFVARLCREGFHHDYVATLGCEKTQVCIDTSKGQMKVVLWDTAGQEKVGPLRDPYYEGATAAILFFDVTSRVTYKNVPVWHRDLLRVCGDIPVVIFANKVDVEERKVKSKSIKYHEKNNSMILVEGSVKDRVNLKQPLEYLLQCVTKDTGLKISSSLESSLFTAFEGIGINKKSKHEPDEEDMSTIDA